MTAPVAPHMRALAALAMRVLVVRSTTVQEGLPIQVLAALAMTALEDRTTMVRAAQLTTAPEAPVTTALVVLATRGQEEPDGIAQRSADTSQPHSPAKSKYAFEPTAEHGLPVSFSTSRGVGGTPAVV